MENLCNGCGLFEKYKQREKQPTCVVARMGMKKNCPCRTCLFKANCSDGCLEFQFYFAKAKEEAGKRK